MQEDEQDHNEKISLADIGIRVIEKIIITFVPSVNDVTPLRVEVKNVMTTDEFSHPINK